MLNTNEIQNWLITHIAEMLDIAPDTIDTRKTFSSYGLSSLDVVTLSGDLEAFLGRRLSPTLAYDYPDILTLSHYLGADMENHKPASIVQVSTDPSTEPIAIIGMACRFPGAKNPEAFWQLLCDGVDAISEVPPDRWQKEAYYHPDPTTPGKSISSWGGFLDRVDQFDPFFFGISPMEAKNMDPQQRLLLEVAYEALDDAGQTIEHLNGTKTGVFIGISVNEYSHLQLSDPLQLTAHSGTGSALSIAANRISYFFNFRGPSMAIDTACSSSLSAVHLACQSLRNNECSMALAGGVNMILSPLHSIAFTKAGVLAPDGKCKTFDARADGYVRGEGGGLIVLKPLSKALADGDPIHALILGSAMGQDGHTNGLMAPSRETQEDLLRDAYKSAGISPGSVQYIEAHGTGTLLGDSIEAQALGAVVGVNRRNGPCAIGSVKTNIGHLESAAGIAGLIKVILSLKHKTIPPSLHFHSPNPYISFNELNLRVENKLQLWPSGSDPALAGVSSFGFGGTNAHVVLQEAGNDKQEEKDDKQQDSTHSNYYLLPLSANSTEQLKSLAGSFQHLLAPGVSIPIYDICYGASLRRSQYNTRMAVTGHSREELYTNLEAFLKEAPSPNVFFGRKIPDHSTKLAFVFSGQGGQWYGMARGLMEQEPVFSQVITRVDQAIQVHTGWSVIDEIYTEQSRSRLGEIDVIQPTLFAVQVALATLWQSWGIMPDAVVGHSMGEVAAAYLAGILNLEDAVLIICYRSQLLVNLQGKGSMLVTELSKDQAMALLRGHEKDVAIAAINSPFSTVLSGTPEALKEIIESLQSQNLFYRSVNVDVASHSPQIEPLRLDLLKALKVIRPMPSKIPLYSTVTGARGDDLNFNAEYWMDNLRKPVLFYNAIEQLLADRHTTFIEIGPHPVLLSSIQQSLLPQHQDSRLLPSLRREEPGRKVLLETLSVLYTEGYAIAWNKIYLNGAKHVPLPLVPWQHQRYWIDAKLGSSNGEWQRGLESGSNFNPILGSRINLANAPLSSVWQPVFNDKVLPFLGDHRVEDEIIFPAAGYIEMALQAAADTGLSNSHELFDFFFNEKLTLQEGNPRSIQALLAPNENGFLFSIYSRTGSEETWVLNASVSFKQVRVADDKLALGWTPILVIQEACTTQFTAEEFYKILQQHGLKYGPGFRAVQHVWSNKSESLGRIQLPESLQCAVGAYQIHPVLLDACLQVLGALPGVLSEHDLYLPTGCRHVRIFSRLDEVLWSQVYLQPNYAPGSEIVLANIRLSDANEQTVAELIGFRLQRMRRSKRPTLSRQNTWFYHLQWQARENFKTPSPINDKKRHWCIFADDEGLGDILAKQLEAGGDYCHVLPCREFLDDQENELGRACPGVIEKHLKKVPAPLYGIIHLWSLCIPPSSTHGSGTSEAMPGCNSILHLVQAVAQNLAALPRLWLVTRGAQPVKAGELVSIEQAPLWGLGKAISFELPELKCIRIDLDPQQTNVDSIPYLIEQVLKDDREDQIAFRSGVQFVSRLLPFSPATASSVKEVLFRADHTYLITGGLGGLGLRVAKWMAQRGARHLVLLGRTEPSSSAISIAESMRHDGIEVTIALADISDRVQFNRVLENIKRSMPVLRGIIHAAGVLDDDSILDLDAERFNKVMAPKVDGTWNLHHATLGLPLEFFVLFSSAVSVLGSPGQGNYAAANAYLDAMAYYRRTLGLPAISINWGPWAEVGLAAEATERLKENNASSQHLIKTIEIDEGLEVLERLLSELTPQVMVLPFDLKNLIELYPTAASMPFLAEVGGSDTHGRRFYVRPNLRQEYVAPRNEIERKLAALWQQTLHIDRIGVHDSFFELGGDSVLAAQILTLAQKAVGIRINPQDAFKAFTIERLTEIIQVEMLSKLEEMTDEEAEQQLLRNN